MTTTSYAVFILFVFLAFLPAAFQFSFGLIPRSGDESTDGPTTLDVAVPVMVSIINSSTNLLTADTVITVSVSGGNATSRSNVVV